MKRLLTSQRGSRSSSSRCSVTSTFLTILILLILATAVILNTHILQKVHLSEQLLLASSDNSMIKSDSAMSRQQDSIRQNSKSTKTIRSSSWLEETGNSNNSTTPYYQPYTMLLPEHPDGNIWRNLNLIWTSRNGTILHNMTETDVNLRRIHPLYGKCPWTAQYELQLIPSINEADEYWQLQSLDNHGRPKTMGGDELYIMYHHRNRTRSTPTAVAYARDQDDGTYRLEFHTTPFTKRHNIDWLNSMGRKGSKMLRNGRFRPSGVDENLKHFKFEGGMLAIFMHYTCGLGTLHHPAKKEWRTGGGIMLKYHTYVPYPPQMKAFEPPNANKAIDLGRYRKVMIFGDSNLQGLFRDHPEGIDNLHFIRKPDSPLHWRSMNKLFLPKIQWFVNLTMYEDEDPSQHRYAIMVGSACWDIVFPETVGHGFKSHLRAVRYMLQQLKYTFGPMGNVDIYWHSGFALHLYVAGLEDGWFDRRPLKYMSYHRSFALYRKQVEILKQLGNVTLLDFMHTTYLCGHQYIRGDARHAMPKLNRRLLGYYYRNVSDS